MNFSNTMLHWIIGFAVTAAIGYACYKKRHSESIAENDECEVASADNESEAREVQPPSLVPVIGYFRGQCNSFQMISEDPHDMRNCEQVFDYANKAIIYHASEDIQKWWRAFTLDRKEWSAELYKEKAAQVISMIRAAGVTPSTETILRWDNNSAMHYMPLGEIDRGELCRIIHPCWIYKSDLFEQGLVRKN